MKKTLLNLFCISIILSTTSCATILTGTKDTLAFQSEPEGAKVMHKGLGGFKCLMQHLIL